VDFLALLKMPTRSRDRTANQVRAQYRQEFGLEAEPQLRAAQAISVVAKVLDIPKAGPGMRGAFG
jgi:hypothetical protein